MNLHLVCPTGEFPQGDPLDGAEPPAVVGGCGDGNCDLALLILVETEPDPSAFSGKSNLSHCSGCACELEPSLCWMPFDLPFRQDPQETVVLGHSCPASLGVPQQWSISHR